MVAGAPFFDFHKSIDISAFCISRGYLFFKNMFRSRKKNLCVSESIQIDNEGQVLGIQRKMSSGNLDRLPSRANVNPC